MSLAAFSAQEAIASSQSCSLRHGFAICLPTQVLLKHCCGVLDSAVGTLSPASSPSALPDAALARRSLALLTSSVVYHLLPSFIGFSCLLSTEPWLGANLLPYFTAACSRLEKFDGLVSTCTLRTYTSFLVVPDSAGRFTSGIIIALSTVVPLSCHPRPI